MNVDILEWIGYTASVIIALSMALNSIVKFRWVNLTGALLFSIYGFLIGALPVGILNGIIVVTDLYYLIRIYSQKDTFAILEIRPDNKYLLRFLDYHSKDIQKYFPNFSYSPDENTISFFVLRNMVVAGVFVARKVADRTLEVQLDYVLPEYRDFKNGRFVYSWLVQNFTEHGFARVWAKAETEKHRNYLLKVGFNITSDGHFYKTLNENQHG